VRVFLPDGDELGSETESDDCYVDFLMVHDVFHGVTDHFKMHHLGRVVF
jgi:hypothetical protein